MRPWSLAFTGCLLAGVGAVGLQSASAAGGPPAAAPRTLAQAMSEGHGHAAGDPLWRGPEREGVDSSAAGVDAGTARPAAALHAGPAAAVTPDQLLSPGDRSGACTIGYGRGRACLPTTPPSAGEMGMTVEQMPWTCAEVRTVLPGGIALNARGVDPARLDGDGDGTACGAGDR